MSAGIRSGVNCTRRSSSPKMTPRVSTSLVLPSPGTPISSRWPPESKVISVSSTTRSCPKITRPMPGAGGGDALAELIDRADERRVVGRRRFHGIRPAHATYPVGCVIDRALVNMRNSERLMASLVMPSDDADDVRLLGAPPAAPAGRIVHADLGIRIDHDGVWYYHGSPIQRKELVCLFASALTVDEHGRLLAGDAG